MGRVPAWWLAALALAAPAAGCAGDGARAEPPVEAEAQRAREPAARELAELRLALDRAAPGRPASLVAVQAAAQDAAAALGRTDRALLVLAARPALDDLTRAALRAEADAVRAARRLAAALGRPHPSSPAIEAAARAADPAAALLPGVAVPVAGALRLAAALRAARAGGPRNDERPAGRGARGGGQQVLR